MPLGKTYSKKGLDNAQSQKIDKVERKVNKLYKSHKADLKYKDYTATGVAPGSTFVAYNISDTAEGDAYGNRDGQKVCLKSLDLNLRMTQNASSNVDAMRVMVLRWKSNCLATVPTRAQVLEYNTVESHHTLAYKDEFNVLFDKTYSMKYLVDSIRLIRKHINLHNSYANHSGSATGNATDGHIFLCFFGVDAAYPSSIQIDSRITFSG